MIRADRPAVHGAAVMLMTMLIAMMAGCGHLPRPHWPWRHNPTPPPVPVHELVITSEGGGVAAFPQYWKRNTLVVDLQTANGTGSIVMKPRVGTVWPVRLALRITPGSIGVLEVRADQRTVLPVTDAGTRPFDLELVPGIYTPKTPQIAVSWGPAAAPAP
jgi:hypothetical protein